MKQTLRTYIIFLTGAALLSFSWLQPTAVYSGVCSQGTGIPPFLEAGANPNLLLVIDNSGSMLDMAYVDKQTYTSNVGNVYQNTCFDESYLTEEDATFNADKVYTGYFDKNTWYQWTEPIAWENNIVYDNDDTSSSNGRLYVATCSGVIPCTSNGTNLENDSGLSWEELNLDNDDGWNSNSVDAGSIVTYNSMIYRRNANSGSNTVFDYNLWDHIEGYFQKTESMPCGDNPSYSYYVVEDARTDLQITFDNDDAPTAVTCVAARGNLLNWASASKFDIQKEILTGGNFYAGDNTIDNDDRLVSEHRGCSGKGFTKQIALNRDSSNTTVDKTLVLKVRGPVEDIDKLDATDFTTRIEIVGLSDAGGVNFEACEDYIALVESGNPANHDMTISLNNCLYAGEPVQAVANIFHSALHDCWKVGRGEDPVHSGNLQSQCEAMYTGGSHNGVDYPQENPWDMSPWDPYYICKGLWDNDDRPTEDNNYQGTGYIGRCWEDWPVGAGGDCQQKECNPSDASEGWEGSSSKGYFKNDVNNIGQFCSDGLQYACENGGFVDLYANNPRCSGAGEKFEPLIVYKNDNTTLCTGTGTANDCQTTGDCWGFGPPGNDPCVLQAEIDYCKDIAVPEVIDPTDLVTGTESGDTVWGIGAALKDSAVYSQLGVEDPLMIMKGYVEYKLPVEQINDDPARPDGPRGVLFDNASKLRIGVMAFKENGSKTECDNFESTCTRTDNFFDVCTSNANSDDCAYCIARQSIEKNCPEGTNYDGAEVLAPLQLGMISTVVNETTTVENWDNYVDIVTEINNTQATSWTPLAEAIYTAIGYYGQNLDLCLDNDDSSSTCGDFSVSANDDPVEYWCQENHILIITEGASSADINARVAAFASGTNGDIDGTDQSCSNGLEGSTYLDDLTWFAKEGNLDAATGGIYETPKLNDEFKRNITTHIITSGSLGYPDNDECTPATIMQYAASNGGGLYLRGENPDDLKDNLESILSDILSRASAGSAASVISSSRSGSGAVYQAIFWPELTDANDNIVNWVGDVHALFMSADGLMYEDTNQDGKLMPSGDLNNNNAKDNDEVAGGDDKRVIFYYSENANKTRGCYNITDFIAGGFVCPDDPDNSFCQTGDDCVEIQDVVYLWSASNKLRDMDPDDRKIFTWNDFNNDGKVTTTDTPSEWFSLDNDVPWGDMNFIAENLASDLRGPVTKDFLTSEDWATFVDNDSSNVELDAMKGLVGWIRGVDQLNDETADDNGNGRLDKTLRSRQFYMDRDSQTKEWRLGDIIHSTPIVVAKPAEAYHYIYRDSTYAQFFKKWAPRRNMIYFGANDGMLHAVNGGFYSEDLNQFCCTPFTDNGACGVPVINGSCATGPDLGEEKWAYIPYNLQPHLKCLADPDYDHKYYVDQKPRIFDVQIFEPDNDHVAGWGTILVGSMRFGGSPVAASDLNNDSNDVREFTSSFFILDITNPEVDPILLGEMTRTTEQVAGEDKYVDLNYTTSSPSMVVMRDNDNFGVRTDWYLVMGNGPTDLDGSNDNDDQGKLVLLPLEWLKGELSSWGTDGIPTSSYGAKKAFRILNKRPDGGTNSGDSGEGGRFLIPRTDSGEPSYVSDIITVDFNVETQGLPLVGGLYRADAVYFGTTDGTGFANYPAPDNDQTYWNGGGRLFRLVTKNDLTNSVEESSKPSEWAAAGWSSPDNDPIRMLVDAKAPITAAQSVGYDGYNFWVYGGTGRFYDKKDKTDDGQYISPADNSKISYFGIREPIDTNGNCYDRRLTWDTINWNINDNDNDGLTHNGTPGDRGLMQVDNIIVERGGQSLDCVHCVDNDDNRYNPNCSSISDTSVCFGNNTGLTASSSYGDLREYIAGTGCDNDDTSTGIDGWYRDFHESRERNLGQAALLGGLLTFTGYQPYEDICKAEGESFLYGVHYQTGVAWTENVFGTYYYGGKEIVMDKLSLGRGLATTPSMHAGSGGQGPAKAFVQTSTGEIVEIVQENLPFDDTKSGRTGWSDRCEP